MEKKDDKSQSPWMHLLEQVLKFLSSTVWPIAVVFVAFIFKNEFSFFLSRLKKGKLGDAEFEFESYLNKVDAEVEEKRVGGDEKIDRNYAVMASVDPRGAILRLWLKVEAELFSMLNAKGLSCEPS